MKTRFTVRKHPTLGKQGYWCVWDRVENRVRGHVRWSKEDVQNQCMHFNRREKAVSA